jgi:putative DNA primase/helicase
MVYGLEMEVPVIGVQNQDSFDPSKYMIESIFIPKLMADSLLAKFHFFTYAETKSIYVYENGIYNPNGIQFVRKEMLKRLGNYFKINHAREVIAQIKIQTMKDINDINRETHLINLNNGIFDTAEWKFKEHDPRFLCTIRIPAKYDPGARCPVINRFLDEVVSADNRQTLLEWAGLMLIPEVKFEKAMMLCGSGGNGKTTFLNLLTALIGAKNTAAISLQKLIDEKSNRFAVAHLFGKLMDVCADIPSTTIHSSAMFKQLIGKDLITAERKFEHSFDFYNKARLIFSARMLPNLAEINDEAYFRRWLIVEFPKRFTGESDDKNIQDKLTTDAELSGFHNLALEGLHTILKNKFTHDLSIEETADLYIKKTNPIYTFIEACLVSSTTDTLKETVYNEYQKWCEQNNEKPLKDNMFGKKMKDLDYKSHQKGDKKYYWKGIAIKADN